MTKQRRNLSTEFKREAAGLVLDQGYSHIEASRSLGVVESALRGWVNQLQQERNGVTPQSKALTPEQQKIQELEARIARLEREKSILKKATALLLLRPLLATSGSTPKKNTGSSTNCSGKIEALPTAAVSCHKATKCFMN